VPHLQAIFAGRQVLESECAVGGDSDLGAPAPSSEGDDPQVLRELRRKTLNASGNSPSGRCIDFDIPGFRDVERQRPHDCRSPPRFFHEQRESIARFRNRNPEFSGGVYQCLILLKKMPLDHAATFNIAIHGISFPGRLSQERHPRDLNRASIPEHAS
jgi:hypothetical protein